MSERADPASTDGLGIGGVDLRGFVHSLDAVRRQSLWKLDQLQMERLRSLQSCKDKQNAYDSAQSTYQAAEDAASHTIQARFDPRLHARNLAYLVRMQQEMALQHDELATARAHYEAAHTRYLQQHQRVDGLEQHRKTAMQDYATEWLRQQAADADRDWMARLSVRGMQHTNALETPRGERP